MRDETTVIHEYPGNLIYIIHRFNDHGHIHCATGPAVIHSTGHEEWYINNILHRADGPAVYDKEGLSEYWLWGKYYSNELAYWTAVQLNDEENTLWL